MTNRLLNVAALLEAGDLVIKGRLVDASNATLLAEVETGNPEGSKIDCIYKPSAGERPLWDFPRGTLANREIATYKLARAVGLTCVPVTVPRLDGPLGAGMAQLWIPEADYQTLVRVRTPEPEDPRYLQVIHARGANGEDVVVEHLDDPTLRRLALFDWVTNNADRKGGHLFLADEHIYAVDHGLTWHVEPKQRTVLWGWSGERFNDDDIKFLSQMQDELVKPEQWHELLTDDELLAAQRRAEELHKEGEFPRPASSEPNIPWPVF